MEHTNCFYIDEYRWWSVFICSDKLSKSLHSSESSWLYWIPIAFKPTSWLQIILLFPASKRLALAIWKAGDCNHLLHAYLIEQLLSESISDQFKVVYISHTQRVTELCSKCWRNRRLMSSSVILSGWSG